MHLVVTEQFLSVNDIMNLISKKLALARYETNGVKLLANMEMTKPTVLMQ